jgi:hypothetical protein
MTLFMPSVFISIYFKYESTLGTQGTRYMRLNLLKNAWLYSPSSSKV